MTANPERQVIDDIDALVDWQIEEGRQREGARPTFIDEAYQWTDAEIREARLRSYSDHSATIDDPALTLPPIRRAWLNDWVIGRGGSSSTP